MLLFPACVLHDRNDFKIALEFPTLTLDGNNQTMIVEVAFVVIRMAATAYGIFHNEFQECAG